MVNEQVLIESSNSMRYDFMLILQSISKRSYKKRRLYSFLSRSSQLQDLIKLSKIQKFRIFLIPTQNIFINSQLILQQFSYQNQFNILFFQTIPTSIITSSSMQRKSNILSDLKKQVLILKTQLDNISRAKNTDRDRSIGNMNKSTMSQSSRFNSTTYDSTYLDKGVKKFPLHQSKYKNLNEIINEKSTVEKQPKLSEYRKAEEIKTRENFSTQPREIMTARTRSPNPLTGEGYTQRKKGIKTLFPKNQSQSPRPERSYSSKRHYPVYYCR